MFTSLRQSLAILCIGVLGGVICESIAQATVLPFNMTPYPGDTIGAYETTFASYGDNVTATTMAGPGVTYFYGMGNGFTPDITIDYTSSPGAGGGHSAFNAQGGWDFPVDYLRYIDGSTFWYTFTPSGAYGVDVNSFDIDIYAGAGQIDWNLRQDTTTGTIFASGTESGLAPGGNPDRTVTIANGTYFGTTILEITISGTSSFGNIGIRNLDFDQVVPPALPAPEPASGLLLALGCASSLVHRTRRAERLR